MNEVDSIIKRWLKTISVQSNTLSKVTDTLPHPFQVLEGDGNHEYSYNPSPNLKPFILEEVEEPITLESISMSQAEADKLLLEIHEVQRNTGRCQQINHQKDTCLIAI